MHEASMAPDRASGVSSGVSSGELIGVSIGAITAAVSAGNPTEKSLEQPDRFRTTIPLCRIWQFTSNRDFCHGVRNATSW
jgi:hypothetical protein